MAKIGTMFLLIYITRTLSNPVMTRENLLKQANKTEMCSKLITFNGAYYTMEELQRLNGIPADLNVHWKTGNIYFTLINDAMKMNLQVIRPSGEVETIKVAGLGQSTCVDNLNDIVYLGTDNGVYTYTDDGHTELYTALGEDIMYIAVSHEGTVMYIATWPQNRVQKVTMDGQKQETFQDIPNGHGLTADTRNNLYFVATKTTYVLKNGQNIPVNIMGLPKDKMTGVYVSRSDDVFAMDENSNFYKIDGENAQAKYLGTFNVKEINTFALDSSDNILIGVNGRILKFVTHESNPCSDIPNLIGKWTDEPNSTEWLKSPMNIKVVKPAQSHSYVANPESNKVGKRHSKKCKKRTTTTTNKVGKRHSKKCKKRATTTTTTEANDDYE